MPRYIVFDVETPNSKNESICSIGISVVEMCQIVEEYHYLVDPEDRFDDFNIRLHGIGPEQVRGKPNFPTLWEELTPLMKSGIWVAHNATFDLGVLKWVFCRYAIPWGPQKYACTVRLGRKCFPQLPDHKLDTMCRYLDIPLDHHNAGSDAHAAAELLRNYLMRGIRMADFIKTYNYYD